MTMSGEGSGEGVYEKRRELGGGRGEVTGNERQMWREDVE